MFGTKLNYDSRLFLEGEEVSGINTVDFSYSNSASTINPLGFSDGVQPSMEKLSKIFLLLEI